MSNDKEIAKKIEDKAAPKDGHVNTHVMDDILNSSHVFNDKTLASAVQNRLQEAGILPQLALDTFSDPKVLKTFEGADGKISQQKLEQAAETGKVDGQDVSATSRFMADALLKRWDDLGTQGRPGVSMQELQAWGSRQDIHTAVEPPLGKAAGAGEIHTAVEPPINTRGAGGEIHTAVEPSNAARDASDRSDRVQATNEGRGDGSIRLPSKEDIATKPISELKEWLHRNEQRLEDAVAKHLPDLQYHRIGFHGTTREGKEGIERDHESHAKNNEVYVATPSHVAATAKEWIANIGRSVEKAADYLEHGGAVAIIDMGTVKERLRPYMPNGGDFIGVTKHGADSTTTQPQTDNPFLPTPEKWGETIKGLTKENFAETLKGWLDPSKWSGLENHGMPRTEEEQDRQNIGQAFARQGMIGEVLDKLGIHLPAEQSAEKPEVEKPQVEKSGSEKPHTELSFDDFMKKISPTLKNITDCHKLWQLLSGKSDEPPADYVPPGQRRPPDGTVGGKNHEPEIQITDPENPNKPRTRGFAPRTREIPPPEKKDEPDVHITDPENPNKPRTRGFHPRTREITPPEGGQKKDEPDVHITDPENPNKPRTRGFAPHKDHSRDLTPPSENKSGSDISDPPSDGRDGPHNPGDNTNDPYKKVLAVIQHQIERSQGWQDRHEGPPKEYEQLDPLQKYKIFEQAQQMAAKMHMSIPHSTWQWIHCRHPDDQWID